MVVNCTAIEAQWQLPPFNGRNGVIRGYKLFYSQDGGQEVSVNITSNETLTYIVGGLQPNTAYTFSVLAYTVADGPKGIHLVAVTFENCKFHSYSNNYYNFIGTISLIRC